MKKNKNNCVSTDQLSQCINDDGPNKGINTTWLIGYKQQWSLLEKCIDKGLITSESLNARAHDGSNKGKNTTWLIGYRQQWGLLTNCIYKGLITSDSINASAHDGPHKGKKTAWMIGSRHQWNLLEICIDKGLITSESLSASAQVGEAKGQDSIFILAKRKKWKLLSKIAVITYQKDKYLSDSMVKSVNKALVGSRKTLAPLKMKDYTEQTFLDFCLLLNMGLCKQCLTKLPPAIEAILKENSSVVNYIASCELTLRGFFVSGTLVENKVPIEVASIILSFLFDSDILTPKDDIVLDYIETKRRHFVRQTLRNAISGSIRQCPNPELASQMNSVKTLFLKNSLLAIDCLKEQGTPVALSASNMRFFRDGLRDITSNGNNFTEEKAQTFFGGFQCN